MSTENKTRPTNISVVDFLDSITENRKREAVILIRIMKEVSKMPAMMWGPSIIGFGSTHYKYDSGREGDMPLLAFSPRKSALTIYFYEGFQHHQKNMNKLGKYRSSISCLYINKLEQVDIDILTKMINDSFLLKNKYRQKPRTVQEYIESIPLSSQGRFAKLRDITKSVLPKDTKEIFSYGIIGYKIDEKRPRVYISGWKDHISIYPVPKDPKLQQQISSYIKGKGTISISNTEEMPLMLIKKIIRALILN